MSQKRPTTSAQKKQRTMRRPRISPLPDPIDVEVPIPAARLHEWEEEQSANIGPDDEE
jgi:hypothetical protein